MKTLVIIPAFNEEGSIEHTVSRLIQTLPDCDFLIVNDGSRDETAAICRRNGYPVIDLPINLGLSGAFQTGMKYALKHNYDCAVQFDADGQHRAEYIKDLAEATTENDIVIGSRFVDGEKSLSPRMIGSNLIQAAIKITTGRTIHDPTSGMRAFGKRMIPKLALERDCGPEPDTISRLIRKENAKVVEIPVIMDDRTAGESYLSFGKSLEYMLRTTISILFIQFFEKEGR